MAIAELKSNNPLEALPSLWIAGIVGRIWCGLWLTFILGPSLAGC
jgi:hypothetical protein